MNLYIQEFDKKQRTFLSHMFGINSDTLDTKLKEFQEFLKKRICDCRGTAVLHCEGNCRQLIKGIDDATEWR